MGGSPKRFDNPKNDLSGGIFPQLPNVNRSRDRPKSKYHPSQPNAANPHRYDSKRRKVCKPQNLNSDLIKVAGERVTDLDLGSRGSTESMENVPELTSGRELVKRFSAKRASTNLNHMKNVSPMGNRNVGNSGIAPPM